LVPKNYFIIKLTASLNLVTTSSDRWCHIKLNNFLNFILSIFLRLEKKILQKFQTTLKNLNVVYAAYYMHLGPHKSGLSSQVGLYSGPSTDKNIFEVGFWCGLCWKISSIENFPCYRYFHQKINIKHFRSPTANCTSIYLPQTFLLSILSCASSASRISSNL
jgi:hypothetical protein